MEPIDEGRNRPCTNDDIAQIKRLFEPEGWNFNKQIMMGIVRRLEAAENSIAHSHGLASIWCCEKAKELDKEWRKSAGIQ